MFPIASNFDISINADKNLNRTIVEPIFYELKMESFMRNTELSTVKSSSIVRIKMCFLYDNSIFHKGVATGFSSINFYPQNKHIMFNRQAFTCLRRKNIEERLIWLSFSLYYCSIKMVVFLSILL